MNLKEARAKATHGKLTAFKTYLIDKTGVVICKLEPTFAEREDAALLAHCYNHFDEVVNRMEAANIELKETLKEIGGCDHSVGICCCGLKEQIASNDDFLAKVKEVNGI